jgi:peptidoglycan/LPS O-acetylase OafA/YrhL
MARDRSVLCLSGFLIGGILLDNKASPSYFATFYIRRGFRIFPIYDLTVSLVLLALPRFSSQADLGFPPGVYLGYMQNFVMPFTGAETTRWLMPTWTLRMEEQFYLLLPIILYLIPPRLLLRALPWRARRLCTAYSAAVEPAERQ